VIASTPVISDFGERCTRIFMSMTVSPSVWDERASCRDSGQTRATLW
jgi:hypothetical protein